MALSMRVYVASVISLLLTVLALRGGAMAAGLFSGEEEEILLWHNQQRSSVSPPATNMLELVWSEELGLMAQNYSQTCPQNEAVNPFLHSLPNTTIGENLLIVNSLTLNGSSYSHLLQTYWADSVLLTPSNCTGEHCKEYIQVVWAMSQFIGCGASLCGDHNETTVIICYYLPGPSDSDLMVFTAPYATGSSGPCSECPSHAPDCQNNSLCYSADTMVSQFNSSSSVSAPSVSYTPTATSTTTPISSSPFSSPTLFTSRSSLTVSKAIRGSPLPLSTPVVLTPPSSTGVLFPISTNSQILLTTTEGDQLVVVTATPMISTPVTSSTDSHMSLNVTQQIVTVTVTYYQSVCPETESGTEIEPCPGADRLPALYVILIGVIPSIVAVALLFLLIIIVCTNRRRKKKTRKQIIEQTTSPRARRRQVQVRDSGMAEQPDRLTSVQLRHVSPLHSLTPSNSADVDLPLLPDPPSPYFTNDNPTRGNTFRLVIPNTSYREGHFSSQSETQPTRDRLNEEVIRVPMVGLEAIREGEDEQEGVGRGGVANIIARMERKQGQAVTTEC